LQVQRVWKLFLRCQSPGYCTHHHPC
jgi:hypothetical protein